MTGSKNGGNETEAKSPRESGEDSEDESEILEESPCGRWSKRRQEVQQRDVPGIDAAYLAMDTDEGMEVVWNEFQVRFSERRNFREQEEKIRLVFDNLTQLDHPNIVKLHKYWIDSKNDKPRVVFITEYMSSGSLKKFLKLTKKNVKKLPLQSWKRWCTQILSALSYLHSCSPPIIHGNLTTDTIFIQHNGLVKIGSVAPDQIHSHVKTCRDDMKNMHFIAPEYGNSSPVTPAVDIYSFGMAALEMAALEIPGNGDSGNVVTQEQVLRTIHSLEHEQQRDFIQKCLIPDQSQRPSTTELLFHPVLFEVHSLKLLAAHALLHKPKSKKLIDNSIEDMLQHQYHSDSVVAEIRHSSGEPTLFRMSDISVFEKLEKFIEDVRFGIYPLTAFMLQQPPPSRPRAISPEAVDPVAPETTESTDQETRKVINMMCNIKRNENGQGLYMTISLRLEDKMNRQLSCVVDDGEGAGALTDELVRYGFISQMDKDEITSLIEDHLTRVRNGSSLSKATGRSGSRGNLLQGDDNLTVMHPPTITTATR
ncbi:nuclear receptor-binding protein homolog isoform X1 [Portunus trituberculatus]|uniref:nuclear receptor-binding protein homolog isoform X1 n=1 Tax=Portunus trituberculatus TaxID=210409 RepID=UPI001E1D1ED1|nr:nuclear receptor-binding protein homolog isoform X1 [Portunus trituberculatus]